MTTVQPSTAPDVKTTLVDTKSPIADVKNGLPFEEVEPHSSPVNLGTLLNEIYEAILRHIVCEKEIAYASTLWIAMTYLVHLFDVIALLIVTAPEMRCGKSEFRRLIGKMVLRPLEADNMSAAVLFRSFDLWHPTLLVDEYDSFVKNNEELRGVFNAGHQRGGCVWRCEGEKFTPKAFDVFGPKVLAGIGRLPSTLVDRGIILQLRRKLPTETIVRQRDVPVGYFREIQSKLARMALDCAIDISAARPMLPESLSDRARDNWEPLFQIAQVAGGGWPERAQYAALKLSREEEGSKTVGAELLSDIHEAFASKKTDRLSSSDIINFLCDDDEKRWATYNRGFPITPTQVAKRLREYAICSNTIRVHGTTAKGYFLRQFTDAFARYVFADQFTDSSAVTPELPTTSAKPPVTLVLPVTPQAVTRNVVATPKSREDAQVVEVPSATVQSPEGNADVTLKASSHDACDAVTADSPKEGGRSGVHHKTIARTAVTALVVQEAMKHIVESREWSQGLPVDCVADAGKVKLPEAGTFTPQAVTRNADVTYRAPFGNNCDAVTAESLEYSNSSRTPHQTTVLSATTALVVQERMNCIAVSQEWPKGWAFDFVADAVKGKLVGIDSRLRRSMTGHILKQLVQKGDLTEHEDLLDLPSNQKGNM